MRIDPGSFSFAISVKGVESDLHPFKQRNALDVIDGHAIFQGEARLIGAQRQAALGRKSPKKDFHATADRSPQYLRGISSSRAVQLTIADGGGFTAEIENLFSFATGKFLNLER